MYKFLKTIGIDDIPSEGWQYITGEDIEQGSLLEAYSQVPWLFRGVNIRANAISRIPFSIYKGDSLIDSSDDYRNVLGFMPSPSSLIARVEAGLTIFGSAYLFRDASRYKVKGLRYLLPSSVTPEITVNKDGTDIKFKRIVNGEPKVYTTQDIIYFWNSDPFKELGEPTSSPAMASANAAGVLLNVDRFAQLFFKQGAVKTTILTTSKIPEVDRKRLKSWWARVTGLERAWRTKIVEADTVKPVTIGEGIDSLANNELTEEKRIDIASALGIPYSVLFSNASNRATAEQDDRHLYDKTIIPDANLIEEVMNDQLFAPLGYRFVFNPQAMELYQKSESERALSLLQMINALKEPEEFVIASEILGYDIPPETQSKLDALLNDRQARREQMSNLIPSSEDNEQTDDQTEPKEDNTKALEADHLDKWHRKAVNRLEQGRPANCPFESDYISPLKHAYISGALEGAETAEDVAMIFADGWVGYP